MLIPTRHGAVTVIVATVLLGIGQASASGDHGFVRSVADQGRVEVSATKPGSSGGKPASGTTARGASQAKPIVAGTSVAIAPDRQLSGVAYAASALIPECWNGSQSDAGCRPATNPDPAAPAPPAPTRAEAEALARTLVSRLQLPTPYPQIGPDPSLNEWNMAVVGVPYWIWADTPTTLTTRVTGYGITITMDAARSHLTVTPGDGTTVTCTATTPYASTAPVGTASPTCGHTFTWPSRTQAAPQGTYRLTATAHWNVRWAALGYAGIIPVTVTDARDLPVTELHAIARVP